MAYIINTYNNDQLTVVQDGTIDQSTDLKLVGRNYAGYGEIQNENFVFLLENFAGGSEPPKAITGQIWFDSSNNKLKFYDGTVWKQAGGAEVADSAPAGLTAGDFWWDENNEQLYAFNGVDWVLVGPQGVGEGLTLFQSRVIKNAASPYTNIPVIVSLIDDEVILIISSIEFTIHPDDLSKYPGFDVLKAGFTLKNTTNSTGGVTSTEHWFWGTASNAKRFDGLTLDKFLLRDNVTFTDQVFFGDAGIAIGNDLDLKIRIINGNKGVIANEQGTEIFFQVLDENLQIAMPFRLESNKILPGYVSNFLQPNIFESTRNVDIGSVDHPFIDVYASTLKGVADKSDLLLGKFINQNSEVDTEYMEASVNHVEATRTIVVRDATGTINGNIFSGTSTSAYYADLAEYFSADRLYTPGTVLRLGGEKEVTESLNYMDVDVIGVVSTNPAHLMNNQMQGMKVPVALKGRVPCFVIGKAKKGDYLVASDTRGVAIVVDKMNLPHSTCIIGRALADKNSEKIALLEIIV